jgi:hypothetical protein
LSSTRISDQGVVGAGSVVLSVGVLESIGGVVVSVGGVVESIAGSAGAAAGAGSSIDLSVVLQALSDSAPTTAKASRELRIMVFMGGVVLVD